MPPKDAEGRSPASPQDPPDEDPLGKLLAAWMDDPEPLACDDVSRLPGLRDHARAVSLQDQRPRPALLEVPRAVPARLQGAAERTQCPHLVAQSAIAVLASATLLWMSAQDKGGFAHRISVLLVGLRPPPASLHVEPNLLLPTLPIRGEDGILNGW